MELVVVDAYSGDASIAEIVADRIRDDEIAIGQPLHQRGSAQAIGAVIGKIGFARGQTGRGCSHQVVVHPQPAHRVVHRRENPHRLLVGLFAVIPCTCRTDCRNAPDDSCRAAYRIGNRDKHPARSPTPRPSSQTPLAARDAMSRGTRLPKPDTCARDSNRARPRESAPAAACRSSFFGTQTRPSFRNALAHQRELRLVFAAHRDARRVNLRVAGIGEKRAPLVGPPDRGDIASPAFVDR